MQENAYVRKQKNTVHIDNLLVGLMCINHKNNRYLVGNVIVFVNTGQKLFL